MRAFCFIYIVFISISASKSEQKGRNFDRRTDKMKKFNSKSCEEIMTTVYKPIEFVVDGLIAQSLYIFAAVPKVGKYD